MIFTDKRLSLCRANWRRKTLPWYKSDVAASADASSRRKELQRYERKSRDSFVSLIQESRFVLTSTHIVNVAYTFKHLYFDSYATLLSDEERKWTTSLWLKFSFSKFTFNFLHTSGSFSVIFRTRLLCWTLFLTYFFNSIFTNKTFYLIFFFV